MPAGTLLELSGEAHADITSHDTYLQGFPHATFERLRRDQPVSWTEEAEGEGFWSVTTSAAEAHRRT